MPESNREMTGVGQSPTDRTLLEPSFRNFAMGAPQEATGPHPCGPLSVDGSNFLVERLTLESPVTKPAATMRDVAASHPDSGPMVVAIQLPPATATYRSEHGASLGPDYQLGKRGPYFVAQRVTIHTIWCWARGVLAVPSTVAICSVRAQLVI